MPLLQEETNFAYARSASLRRPGLFRAAVVETPLVVFPPWLVQDVCSPIIQQLADMLRRVVGILGPVNHATNAPRAGAGADVGAGGREGKGRKAGQSKKSKARVPQLIRYNAVE